MACSNCYNGCTEITSDKCVKYTGVDVPVLGIQNGDSLSYVEQALIEFLTSTLDGTGIKPVIDPEIICDLISTYLPTCEDLTAENLFIALIKAACHLQEDVLALYAKFEQLEAGYQVGCLEGVTDATNTHQVLQIVINTLCELQVDVAALALVVDTEYVKLADLNTLIQAYLDSLASSGKFYQRMVPYTVVEYYGTLSNFDSSGSGLGNWEQIYLCNGDHGTPDKRGRSPIGAIQGVGGVNAPDDEVNPGLPGNVNYAVGTKNGVNTVTLITSQIPSHIHANILNFTDPGHTHPYIKPTANGSASGNADNHPDGPLVTANTTSNTTGITASLTNVAQGGGQSHNNVHPVIACYYIMYIPNP